MCTGRTGRICVCFCNLIVQFTKLLVTKTIPTGNDEPVMNTCVQTKLRHQVGNYLRMFFFGKISEDFT